MKNEWRLIDQLLNANWVVLIHSSSQKKSHCVAPIVITSSRKVKSFHGVFKMSTAVQDSQLWQDTRRCWTVGQQRGSRLVCVIGPTWALTWLYKSVSATVGAVVHDICLHWTLLWKRCDWNRIQMTSNGDTDDFWFISASLWGYFTCEIFRPSILKIQSYMYSEILPKHLHWLDFWMQ